MTRKSAVSPVPACSLWCSTRRKPCAISVLKSLTSPSRLSRGRQRAQSDTRDTPGRPRPGVSLKQSESLRINQKGSRRQAAPLASSESPIAISDTPACPDRFLDPIIGPAVTRSTPNREHAGESTRVRPREEGTVFATARPVTSTLVPPKKPPGGPVAARHRSVWFSTLETDQGVTVTVKFTLLPALFHLTVFEDV
jgi:hypothetical protein